MFAFDDGVPDMACKIATIEPATRMYLPGVSIDRAADWDDQVKMKLKHALTHGGCLEDSADWDQQANWSNRGIPLWVMDDKYGQVVGHVKGEEPELQVEKGQAEPVQAPGAKRKLIGEEPAPKKKKTASKPPAAKDTKGGDADESNKEEEDEEEEEEEDTSPAKRPKKAAERSETEEASGRVRGTIRAPFKQPARHSVPREHPAKPAPKGKTLVANSLGAKLAIAPKKK